MFTVERERQRKALVLKGTGWGYFFTTVTSQSFRKGRINQIHYGTWSIIVVGEVGEGQRTAKELKGRTELRYHIHTPRERFRMHAWICVPDHIHIVWVYL